jgi:L-rhamnose isomerase
MPVSLPSNKKGFVSEAFALACSRFETLGLNPETALNRLAGFSLSLPCWQGDDVVGFEADAPPTPSGGIAITGSYPGRARCPEELRSDLSAALRLIPGSHRVNLHASYADFQGKPVDRDALEPVHFRSWIDWALSKKIGLDFNPTFFAHPKSADGFTLSHRDSGVRAFWIEHGRRCRRIGQAFGDALGTPCVTNVWIPDGSKDTPVDRSAPRERLLGALDALFEESLSGILDAVEPKLFGIGSESYVVGSYDFYLAYATRNRQALCLDSGHFHPTENVGDKISSLLQFLPRLLLHLSRGVRWDSDHVVIENDPLQELVREIVVHGWEKRVHLGLDFFDASINRVAAWVIGARATQKALLRALLEPTETLRKAEESGDFTRRLALQEECRSLPYGAVWDEFCLRHNVPVGLDWLTEVRAYEAHVLSKRL